MIYATDPQGNVHASKDYQRHLAGDYAPNFPKPKAVANNNLFDWGSSSSREPFDSKKFWDAQAEQKMNKN